MFEINECENCKYYEPYNILFPKIECYICKKGFDYMFEEKINTSNENNNQKDKGDK